MAWRRQPKQDVGTFRQRWGSHTMRVSAAPRVCFESCQASGWPDIVRLLPFANDFAQICCCCRSCWFSFVVLFLLSFLFVVF